MSDPWISPRFEREVAKHLFMNEFYHFRRFPLMLIIQGPKGTGKTTQIRAILEARNIECVEAPSARMAGDENIATKALLEFYGSASSMIDTEKRAALLIDDLDLSILSRKANTNYSQNTQLLNVTFMSLCDNPKRALGTSVHRVPIFATVNEVAGFHSPLVRTGRARIWNWVPTDTERATIASTKLPFLSQGEIKALDKELIRQEGFGILDEILHELLFSIHEDDPSIRRARHDLAVKEADRRLAMTKMNEILRIGRSIIAERRVQSQL